ncbi:hypothetical protein E2562_036028 [Oryza meyeriana var. granulata]|uniref:CID domain-containing protein n=1 Tax=Oryza meyeriana var. granulata TaxID=110450 RepID=A0A6G1CW05_9ORYZ|nr:hypothetical protein E2562_036028 [Oryza meyeriana var. granulata]
MAYAQAQQQQQPPPQYGFHPQAAPPQYPHHPHAAPPFAAPLPQYAPYPRAMPPPQAQQLYPHLPPHQQPPPFAAHPYMLWVSPRPPVAPYPPGSMHMMPSLGPMMRGPPMHQPGYPPFYDQHQHFGPHGHGEYEAAPQSFKGLSGPLPVDVAAELHEVLTNLNGTKESIKGAKTWFMQRSPFAPALAEALKDRVFALEDSERQLHIVFLVNDILFESLQRRTNARDLDNEALAFKSVLGSMLARIYSNPQSKDGNQIRLEKILQFWGSKEVYEQETIANLERDMKGGTPAVLPQTTATPAITNDPNPPPYPLFPPGLIPGMVRKMQIGSGVPYSPLSPLDIPTIIPPSTIPESEILECVSKFFKEIGEVNPSEGPMKQSEPDNYDNYERDFPARKGGACIPPPPTLLVNPETGMCADGSVDSKPGSTGRLGLGASADPNEIGQYDDVYSSYRKQRSSTYHSSISARSSAPK